MTKGNLNLQRLLEAGKNIGLSVCVLFPNPTKKGNEFLILRFNLWEVFLFLILNFLMGELTEKIKTPFLIKNNSYCLIFIVFVWIGVE